MLRRSRNPPALVVAAWLLVLGAGCGSDRKPTTASSTAVVSRASSPAPTSTTAAKATGSLTVFAAASLTESFADLQATLKTSDPDLALTYNFAGSGALVRQVQQGAPADVIATADDDSMNRLVDAELVDPPVTFARNKMEILVAPGNPLGIETLADLPRTGVKLVLEDETVPAGKYAAQALAKAGVTVSPVSKEADVKSAVAKITSGEGDATIVYVTDVTAVGSLGQGVEIPDAQNIIADYPIAVVKATGNRGAAEAFVAAVVDGSGQAALARRGFLAPN